MQKASVVSEVNSSDQHGEENVSHPDEFSKEETFRIAIVINNIAAMFSDMANNKGIQLSCMSSSARVNANPIVVMRILSNLTENALKYTARGKILVGCRRKPERLDIQVWDTGPGFSKSEKEQFFTAYQRGNNSDIEGLGLGLAIVQQLSLEHNYNLILRTEVGKGSMFQFSLPLANS